MDQGTGAEGLSELTWWKRPFARLSEKKPKPEKGMDITPSEEPPEKILDKEISATTVEPGVSMKEGITPKPIEEISQAAPSSTIDEVRSVVHEEISRIEADLSNLVQQEVDRKLAAYEPKTSGGMGLWATLLGLVLISTVGVAGILLARQANDENTRSLVEIAALYQATGKLYDAILVLDKAVEAGIADAETLGQVGEIYRELKQYERAIDILNQAIEKSPDNEIYRLSLARSNSGFGQYQEAINEYEELVLINPSNVTYYFEMGNNYRLLKNLYEALIQYQKTTEIDPTYWLGLYNQGGVYREQQMCNKAIDLYQKAIDITPNFFSWLYSGVCYSKMGNYDLAEEQFKYAITNNPNRAESYYYMGESYLAQGNFEKAIEFYLQAIELNEKYTEAHISLGISYSAQDNCENATLHFMEVLKSDPQNTVAQQGIDACKGK